MNTRLLSIWLEPIIYNFLRQLTVKSETPYCLISTFLPPKVAERFLHDIIERQDEFIERGVGISGNPAFYRMKLPILPPTEFLSRFEELTPMLERRFGTDLSEPEIALVAQAYKDGSFFGKHSDADAGGPNWQRRLSGIFYLHEYPRKFEGGDLILYDRYGHAHLVDPGHNSAIFFPRQMLHEVLPISCASKAFEHSRFAINIWIS